MAIAGSLIGTLAGVGYAALMLFGLRTWWLPAIGTPFLTLHVSWQSPAIGFASGLLMALAAIWLAVRPHGPHRAAAAVGGRGEEAVRRGQSRQYQPVSAVAPYRTVLICPPLSPLRCFLASCSLLLLALAPAAILLLVRLGEEAQVGAFFGAGSLALVSLLTLVYLQLRRGATGPAVARGRGNLLRMALRNAARNPGRSALAIGLTASACFLIAAVSVFRIDPARQAADRTQRQRRLCPDRPERVADPL